MAKIKTQIYEYPENLIYDILGEKIKLPHDIKASTAYVLGLLPEKGEEYIMFYYKMGYTQQKIADIYNISRQAVNSQINRMLCHIRESPIMIEYLTRGIDSMINEQINAVITLSPDKIIDIQTNLTTIINHSEFEKLPIEHLELHIRGYNCLKRNGINTISDILRLTKQDLKNIPYIGHKLYEDIINKLAKYGYKLKPY